MAFILGLIDREIMKILITGAGGAAAVSVWKSLGAEHELFMADMDPCAAGLYLVPPERRLIIPAGNASDFLPHLLNICEKNQIQILIPTVDTELLPIAQNLEQFTKTKTRVPISPATTLALCRDKFKLLSCCQDTGLTPTFSLWTETSATPIFPCFAKPREGAGSRGALTIHSQEELAPLPRNSSYLIQELLPGEEYSVDVYISSKGHALAAVPRLRMKIDSGIAVACRTKIDPELSEMALKIAKKAGIVFVANIQFKANAHNQFKLLEINPRFPGTLPLTSAAGIDIPNLLIKDLNNQPLGNDLLAFKELMVVRYWTEEFFPIDEWRSLCL
jgi:carbamoyl-phosphate synthase large subunit